MTQKEKDRLQYMISVMQAALEGKKIEFQLKDDSWVDVNTPSWGWNLCQYRAKPEPPKPQYRPFVYAEEIMEAIKEHGHFLIRKSTGTYKPIREFDDGCVWINISGIGDSFASVFDNYTFADGTPFGKRVTE